MKFADAIDEFILDRRSQGRINSPNTEAAYRGALELHCDDVSNRDPAKTGRDDVKRTLRRWTHPNTQRQKHSILTSFYDWAMEEGYRETNPARAVVKARPRQVSVYRPTREEAVRIAAACETRRERWVIHLGLLAGLRREELRLLQGRHFSRAGFVWVSKDIGKGGRERWIPVLRELAPTVLEIQALVIEPDAWVFPGRRNNATDNSKQRDADTPISDGGMFAIVERVGRRAKLPVDIGPHTLRHSFGDYVTRRAGLKVAQALMGHASSATTEASYTGKVTLDELIVGIGDVAYGFDESVSDRSAGLVSHNVDSDQPAAQSQTEKGEGDV